MGCRGQSRRIRATIGKPNSPNLYSQRNTTSYALLVQIHSAFRFRFEPFELLDCDPRPISYRINQASRQAVYRMRMLRSTKLGDTIQISNSRSNSGPKSTSRANSGSAEPCISRVDRDGPSCGSARAMKFISKTKPIRLNYPMQDIIHEVYASPVESASYKGRRQTGRSRFASTPRLILPFAPRSVVANTCVYPVRLREGRLYIMKIRLIGIECTRIRELASLSLFAFRSMGTKNIFVWADGRLQPRGYLRGGLRFERF